MQIYLLILLILGLAIGGTDKSEQINEEMVVGEMVSGRIDPGISNQNRHSIKIDSLQKKYLFIRINTLNANRVSIGFYSKQSSTLLFSCMNNVYDTCYIKNALLQENTGYVILVMSNVVVSYNLYTYWGDLQHLVPNKEIKFMFDKEDKTQLFHIQIGNKTNFSQLRIMLQPETMRTEGDSLKIFVSVGEIQEPTQQKHDFESVHVWNDAQVIFLTKQDIKDEKRVSVYIVGNAKTIYILSCQFIEEEYHQLKINENLYEYIQPRKQARYHMKLKQQSNELNVDSYVIRLSVFTGNVEVGFYYDREMQKSFNRLPFQYMSDIQFHIRKEDLTQDTEDLYMKLKTNESVCTFQVNFQGRKKINAFQMYENVFEFVPVKQKQSMYFYSHIWNENQFDIPKLQTFDISLIKVSGQTMITFYLCLPNVNQYACKLTSDNEIFRQSTQILNPTEKETIGMKIFFTIQIQQQKYREVNSVEKRALIIAELMAIGSDSTYAAVQFSNPNKIRLLREGRAFEDKVRLSQKKYYKYQNDNSLVKMIKIHINEISGLTRIVAKRNDIRLKNGQQIKIDPQIPNTLVITTQITNPIYIQIKGVVTSIYTVSVSLVYDEHPALNSLVMAQNIQYEIKLIPYQHANIEIHPIESFVIFHYHCEGGSIFICEIDERDVCLNDTKSYGNKGELQINSEMRSSQIRIKLININIDNSTTNKLIKESNINHRRIKVTLKYYAKGKKGCQQKRINKVYSQLITSGQCFKFHLPLVDDDVEMLMSQQKLSSSYLLYFLCSKKIVPKFYDDRYRIQRVMMIENCRDQLNDIKLQVVVGDSSSHTDSRNIFKMDYSVEYANDIITLADGVAYYTKTKSLQSVIKTFFYSIIDETNSVQIVLFNKKGIQHFYAVIAQQQYRYLHGITESQATIDSKTSNYYHNPSIEITKQDIQNSKCGRSCLIIISIFSREIPGEQIQFGIQVTQNQIQLKEDQIKCDFLSKGSVKYYEYTSRSTTTDLFFKTSDNNRRCAKSYLSTYPFPSPSNNIMVENQGMLIYKGAGKGTYYFAVEALDDCPFSISVTEGQSTLTKIEHGQQYDIKLNVDEEKWFYLQHVSKSSFKIISLLKNGLAEISVTKIDLQNFTKQELSTLKRQTFPFRNIYPNLLTIDSEQKQFCFYCFYLVNIFAKQKTQSSIFLGEQTAKISLQAGKILFDEIKKINNVTLAIFYKISNGNIQVSVHSGKIRLEMEYQNQRFEKQFQKNKKMYIQQYLFDQVEGKYLPLQIKITALEVPAVYSFQIQPQIQNSKNVIKLNPGEVAELYFKQQEQPVCFHGVLRSNNQDIYITVDENENVDLSKLVVSAKINGKVESIEKEIIGNILGIRWMVANGLFSEIVNYSLCITTKEQYSFEFSALQNQKMNVIPSDTELLIQKQGTFSILYNGYILIDLFECRGKAEIFYSSNANELAKKKQSSHLQIMGISGQNHAIKIQSNQVLFFRVRTQRATLMWMPLILQKEKGIGYYKYAIGNLSYSTRYNSIKFVIGGIWISKSTRTTVQLIKYTLYISDQREFLQEGVMCRKNYENKLLSININSSEIGELSSPQILVDIEKKKITDIFPSGQTLYFSAVADLTLVPPDYDKEHEHQRFVYGQQVVAAELFRQSKMEQRISANLLYGLIGCIVLCCVGMGCVVVRWVVPEVRKIRMRVLVDENLKEEEFQGPVSSERNQIDTNEIIK